MGMSILQVEQLSDHVFFPNEPISFQMSQNVSLVHTLDLAAEKISAIFKVVQVVCQGSKVGDLRPESKSMLAINWSSFQAIHFQFRVARKKSTVVIMF
jgi:hypothetical protein